VRRAASVCCAPGCPNAAVLKGRCLKHAPKPWAGSEQNRDPRGVSAATHCRRSGADGSTRLADDVSAADTAMSRSCSTISVSLATTRRHLFSVSVATTENTDTREWQGRPSLAAAGDDLVSDYRGAITPEFSARLRGRMKGLRQPDSHGE
jgi:hypothetical protein